MLQRALNPTYRLSQKCLINLQLINLNQINQKRYFIKRVLDTKTRPKLKLFVISFASGIALVTYYDYKKENSITDTLQSTNKEWDSIQRKVNEHVIGNTLIGNYLNASILDDIKIDKKIDGKNQLDGKRLILFQYTNCPFCCKIRTFLNYFGIPYEIVEVNPLTRKQIKFSKTYRKVPILLFIDDELKNQTNQIIQLNDSSLIISILGTYLFANKAKESIESIINKYEGLQYTDLVSKRQISEITNKYFLLYGDNISEKDYKSMENNLSKERKFRKWTDDKFVHVLSPNIYRTNKEAIQAFNYFSEVSDWERIFSSIERQSVIYLGAFAMYLLSKRLKKKYQLKGDVRQSLYDDCNYFLKEKGSQNEFMGGKKPNLGDLSVFGALSSIEGCDAFKDLIENTNIKKWYFKMKELVEQQKGSDLLKI